MARHLPSSILGAGEVPRRLGVPAAVGPLSLSLSLRVSIYLSLSPLARPPSTLPVRAEEQSPDASQLSRAPRSPLSPGHLPPTFIYLFILLGVIFSPRPPPVNDHTYIFLLL